MPSKNNLVLAYKKAPKTKFYRISLPLAPTLPKIFRPVTRNTLIFLFGLRISVNAQYIQNSVDWTVKPQSSDSNITQLTFRQQKTVAPLRHRHGLSKQQNSHILRTHSRNLGKGNQNK